MTDQSTSHSTSWLQRLALTTGGIAFAGLLVLLLLTAFPTLRYDPAARGEAGTTVEVAFYMTDGDMFVYQPGRVRPPDEDVMLSRHVLAWDADGFRLPAQPATAYPIAAFGDSFTEATMVATPWPDVLAAELGIPVRNYGYRGYGPREIAATASQFAQVEPRQWVLYAHFSGNDLMNANRSIEQDLMARNPLGQVQWIARRAENNLEAAQILTNENDHYDYPVPVITNGNYYELALLEDLLWWQVAPPEGFLNNRTFDVVGDALATIAATIPDTTCRAVIFVPSKEQVYYPYIHEGERRWLRDNARALFLTERNTLQLRDAPFSAEDEGAFIAHLGDQRDALEQLAAEQGWLFIDLLAPFEARAAAGELLYYRYDGHWNQDGHDLAGTIIADFMRDVADCAPPTDIAATGGSP